MSDGIQRHSVNFLQTATEIPYVQRHQTQVAKQRADDAQVNAVLT